MGYGRYLRNAFIKEYMRRAALPTASGRWRACGERPVSQRNSGIDLSRINLNLLRIFAMIGRERSITVAGEKLGLSQSAVSHALAQLRYIFNDELFTRTASGMMPTPLAADVGERLPQALLDLEAAISPRIFDPLKTTRKFTIACGDYTTYTFLPKLVRELETAAPRAELAVLPLGRRLIEQLDAGKLDLVIAGVRGVPERMDYAPLFEERTIWVVRRGNPLAGCSVAEWLSANMKTVVVDYGFGQLSSDENVFVNWEGLSQWTRNVPENRAADQTKDISDKIVVPNFFAAIALVTQFDFMTQIPERLARLLARRHDLVLCDHWPANNGGDLSQIWHRAYGNKPALRWLRDIVKRCAENERE